MAFDLASAPRIGLAVQLCFSVNDFDETLPGPFEWDVKRLVASFAVGGRDRGFDTKQRKSINLATARSYREVMLDPGADEKLDVWYFRLDIEEIDARLRGQTKKGQVKRFEQNVAKARMGVRNAASPRPRYRVSRRAPGQSSLMSGPVHLDWAPVRAMPQNRPVYGP
jgi:uncharacterized protein (DUF2252 family)